jgi:hypothetical protein
LFKLSYKKEKLTKPILGLWTDAVPLSLPLRLPVAFGEVPVPGDSFSASSKVQVQESVAENEANKAQTVSPCFSTRKLKLDPLA